MERPRLRLLRADEGAAARTPGAVLAIGAACAALALATVPLGARDARRPLDASARAERALLDALARGPDDARVGAALVEIRSWLGRRPLDARARAAYASLLAEIATTGAERKVAAFHARVAARTAPFTVPVVAMTARALIGTGDAAAALDLVETMFAWAPRDAATLLAAVEGFVGRRAAEAAVPDTVDARLAWVRELRAARRGDDVRRLLESTAARWPESLRAREQAAADALSRGDVAALARLVPTETDLPRTVEAAGLWALRARSRVSGGDVAGGREDALEAARLSPASAAVQVNAARALEAAGDLDRAVLLWTRARYLLETAGRPDREIVPILIASARIEERRGKPGDALRLWGEVLAIEPDHPSARARVEALRSGRP